MAVGIASLIVSPAPGNPPNDLCSSPTPLAGYPTVAWDTTEAQTDGTAHPDCLYESDGQFFRDVWFVWSSPASGPFIISTCGGTNVDTRLAVYSASTCPSTGPIICDDNSCESQSTVAFNASLGASYLIRVGGATELDFGVGTFTIASGVVAGPIAGPGGTSNYYLVQASTWNLGESIAVALGGHLVTITDEAENTFVRDSVLSFDQQPRRAWIGLSSPQLDGTFVWSSGDTSAFRHWIPGEPNNLDGLEYTAEMVNILDFNGRWNDVPFDHAATRFGIVEVQVSTLCPADMDDNGDFTDGGTPDGAVTIDDLLYFLVGFEAGSIEVDLDNDGDPAVGTPDGGTDINDLLYFLVRFENGC
jgi:Lectin C-type domain